MKHKINQVNKLSNQNYILIHLKAITSFEKKIWIIFASTSHIMIVNHTSARRRHSPLVVSHASYSCASTIKAELLLPTTSFIDYSKSMVKSKKYSFLKKLRSGKPSWRWTVCLAQQRPRSV